MLKEIEKERFKRKKRIQRKKEGLEKKRGLKREFRKQILSIFIKI